MNTKRGEITMSEESWFVCGGNDYVLTEKSGRIYVRKSDWSGQRDIGEADNVQEAFALIKADAGSERIERR
jgi:hypothetical protein